MSALPLFDPEPEESPFGEDMHRPPVKARDENVNAGIGDLDAWALEEKEKKAKPVKPPDEPALRKIQELHPGKYAKVEKTITMLHTARGQRPSFENAFMKTQDLWGFLDYSGVSKGAYIGLQITTRAQIAAHLRGFVNPTNTHGAGGTTVLQHIREFFQHGGTFYIFGMHQAGGRGSRWEVEVVRVTEELLQAYIARRRK